MSFIMGTFWMELLTLIVTLVAVAVAFFKWRFTYWQKRGFPIVEEPTIPFGNARDMLLRRRTFGDQFKDVYNKIKAKGLKHAGFYAGSRLLYVPIDPELLRHILQKDFQHFVNHGAYYDEESDPLSGHLFNLEDSRWRHMRNKLSPTFTSGKMKMMFQTLVDTTKGLKIVMDECAAKNEPIDIKDILGRFTTDIISSCAFGLDCDSLEDPDNEFRRHGKMIFDNSGFQITKFLLTFTFPHKLLHLMKLKLTRTEVETFFMKAVKDTVDYREKNNIYRKDFMHLLLQLKNRGIVADDDKIKDDGNVKSDEETLSFNEMCAQAFVFFGAGFETSSTTMTFASLELAQRPDIQAKLRKEINEVLAKHDGELTYEAIQEMKYLDNVINETLRKHPPVPFLPRKCNKDYPIPGTSLVLEKGTPVNIPVLGLQHDPEYYPNPENFDPDRFSDERKSELTPMTFLPFGEGPRMCIGLRFGVMQSKVGLVTLLKNFEISLNEKTQLPITYDKLSFILSITGGLWIDVKKISQD